MDFANTLDYSFYYCRNLLSLPLLTFNSPRRTSVAVLCKHHGLKKTLPVCSTFSIFQRFQQLPGEHRFLDSSAAARRFLALLYTREALFGNRLSAAAVHSLKY